jgi:RNA polymerase sigma-70 factor (ECF subfamily)
LHRYKPNGSFYGWVKRICINQIIDQIRKEKKFKHIEKLNDEDLLWIEESPQEESPPTKIQLDRFIARLPEQKRIIFNLYYIEQLSHRDIAKQLGIKEKTSSSLLYKARQLLTKWIQDEQLEKDY